MRIFQINIYINYIEIHSMPIEIDDTNIIINDGSTTSNILEVIKSKGSYTEKAADGATYSCGEGNYGRLGHGNTSDKYTPTLIQYFITNKITISQVSSGNYHSIFLDTNGYVYTCGYGDVRLGHGSIGHMYIPTLIQTFTDSNGDTNYTNITITQISPGEGHSLFLDTNGNVYSCGRGYSGQLGHGNTSDKYTPTLIQNYIDSNGTSINYTNITILQISGGDEHSLFLDTNGYVYSCGNGYYGQLGHGDTTTVYTPTLIEYYIDSNGTSINYTNITITQISAGNYHNIFLDTNGYVYSCGKGAVGRLGQGDDISDKYTPTLIQTFTDSNGNTNYTNITITQISPGEGHSLFLDTNGNVYSCGSGGSGRLGHGNTSTKSIPTLIQYFVNNNITILQVSGGSQHSLFFSNDPYFATIEYPAQWTYSDTDASVYHLGNVGIGTEADTSKSLTITGDINVDGNIFIDDAKISLPKYKYSSYDNEPTISNTVIALPAPDNLTHNYIAFTYDSTRDTNGQTEYTINFPEDTTCDILIVGGGGAGGGYDDGGGGGAGGLVLINNITLNGEYKLFVGKGGVGKSNNNIAENGKDSIFNINGVDGENSFTSKGGGGGGIGEISDNVRKGQDGGSGGGASGERSSNSIRLGGNSTQDEYIYNGIKRGFGNKGGDPYTNGGTGSAGGGGAGFPGTNSNSTVHGVPGGDGLAIVNEINLKTFFNINNTSIGEHHTDGNVYFAGGGGGGNTNTYARLDNRGGLGGGGRGSTRGGNATNGLINSGGGGGGAQYYNGSYRAGDGGSGVIIIRYALGTALNYLSNWTYSSSYDEVSLMGYVGIGKAPTTELDVDGIFIANAKNFKIDHPIVNNMHLYHACIEGPRFDNIYRGKKVIVNGYCEVDIDTECNNTGGMIPGTFVALNTDYQLYLQNNQTFDKVKGYIEDGKIKINSLNTTDNILVDWLVIGERQDRGIIKSSLTNAKGKLICEH